jgi:hypothetical protein
MESLLALEASRKLFSYDEFSPATFATPTHKVEAIFVNINN